MQAFALSLGLSLYFAALGNLMLAALPNALPRQVRALIAPAAGSCAVVIFVFTLSRFGLPVARFALPLFGGTLLLLGAACLRVRDWKAALLPVASMGGFAALQLLTLGSPLLQLNFHWLSFGNTDMTHYALNAERFVAHGFFAPPEPAAFLGHRDFSASPWSAMVVNGERPGTELLLAFVSALTGVSPDQHYMATEFAFFLALVGGAGALVRLRTADRFATIFAMLLVSASSLTVLGVYYQLAPQVWGLGVLCCALVVTAPLGREHPPLQEFLLPGIVFGALAIVYPETLPFAALTAAIAAGRRALRLRKPAISAARLAGLGLALAVALLLLNSYALRALQFIEYQSAGGNLTHLAVRQFGFFYFLVPSGAANFWGFSAVGTTTAEPWNSITIAAGLALWAAAATVCALRLRSGDAEADLLAVMGALAVWFFVSRKDFALFKLMMYLQPFLVAAFVTAARRGLGAARQEAPGRARRLIAYAAIFAVALAGLPTVAYYYGRSVASEGSAFNLMPGASAADLQDQSSRFAASLAPGRTVVFEVVNPGVAFLQVLHHNPNVAYFFPAYPGDFPGLEFPMQVRLTAIFKRDQIALLKQLVGAVTAERERSAIRTALGTNDGFGADKRYRDSGALVAVTQADRDLFGSERTLGAGWIKVVPPDALRNFLAFRTSDLGELGAFFRGNESLFLPEPDPLRPGRSIAALGHYVLFEVTNPSPRIRFELEIARLQDRRNLPPAHVVGASDVRLPIVGFGLARVVSPPLATFGALGRHYVLLDMGEQPDFAPARISGLGNLYGRDVPRDYRRMTAYLRHATIVDDAEYRRRPHPATLTLPADLARPGVEFSGITDDGWVSDRCAVVLQSPEGGVPLVVRGDVPQVPGPPFTNDVTVLVDGKPIARRSLSAGQFSLRLPGGSRGVHRVELRFARLQMLPAPDERMVGAHLAAVGFGQLPVAVAKDDPTVAAERIELRGDWYGLEHFGGEDFHWAGKDVTLVVAGARGATLEVAAEAGPSVGGVAPLRIYRDGRLQSSVLLRGRQRLRVPLVAATSVVRFEVTAPSRPPAGDPRTLDWRVFRVTLSGASPAGR